MSEGIIIAVIGGFFTVFTVVFGYFVSKNTAAEKERKRQEKEIGELRNLRDEAEEKKNDAHDKLTRQMANCMACGNDKKKLPPLIKNAEEADEEWKEKSAELFTKMRNAWKE